MDYGLSMEKEMATYSSILALRIPWTEEPGSVGHGLLTAAAFLIAEHGL